MNKNRLGVDPLLDEMAAYKTELARGSVEQQYERICKIIEELPDINALRDNGMTYLMIAVRQYKVDIIELLLECGADPNVGDKNNLRPLSLSLIMNVPQQLTIINLLLQYGANPNLPNKSGQTPIDVARLSSEESIIELLINYPVS